MSGEERAESFLELFDDMATNGYDQTKPVMVADVSSLGLGFDLFRFDGCHRLCAAHVLGIKEVPAYVFRLEEGPPSGGR